MTLLGWAQALCCLGIVTALTPGLGRYLHHIYETPAPWGLRMAALERWLLGYASAGLPAPGPGTEGLAGAPEPLPEQSWSAYAGALLGFSACTVLLTFALLLLQAQLPLNPEGFAAMPWALALNTAISFATNTNWQAYAGETTLSPLSQLLALTPQNFISAAVGMGVAMALARGLTRQGATTQGIGNFWQDLFRSVFFVLLPLSLGLTLLLVALGVPQTLDSSVTFHTLEGASQRLALGPVASQEAIKLLGTNGGGYFNANSAHPFENPSPLSNLLSVVLILLIPAALTYTYGRMARNPREGWSLFAAMLVLLLLGLYGVGWAEAQPNPALQGMGLDQAVGNLEGKEIRFGVAGSALFATATTAASCGAVNAMHDSFNPLGGLVTLLNIQLGEVVFGGVGAGLYGMLMMVILTVFLAGLMVGRTPEYLGKKIEQREIQLATFYTLIMPFSILIPTALSMQLADARSSIQDAGPHGFSEVLYAFTSAAGNNGSAFAGLNANTDWYNLTLSVCMLLGRYAMILPVLGLAGAMVSKKTLPPGPGTFTTHGVLFATLLVAVILIVGALTFFPVLSLGPLVEHFLALKGEVF